MLFPKKVKFRKWQTARKSRKKSNSPETRGLSLSFGSFGLKAISPGRIKSNQIEAGRKTLSRALGKTGKIWIRIFPDRPYTSKGGEVGMGKGKGDPQGYVFEVKPGRIIFEVDGAEAVIAKDALRKAGAKLPVTAKVVQRIG